MEAPGLDRRRFIGASVFLEMFKTLEFEHLSLATWVTHAPPRLMMDHLRISADTIKAIPEGNSSVVPV